MHMMENLLKYKFSKNYQNRAWFDKVIAKKNKTMQFFTHVLVARGRCAGWEMQHISWPVRGEIVAPFCQRLKDQCQALGDIEPLPVLSEFVLDFR